MEKKAWRPGCWVTNTGICVSWPHMNQVYTPELMRKAAAAQAVDDIIRRIMQ